MTWEVIVQLILHESAVTCLDFLLPAILPLPFYFCGNMIVVLLHAELFVKRQKDVIHGTTSNDFQNTVFFKWTIECHSNESGYNAGYNDRMALHLPSLLLIIVVLSLSLTIALTMFRL